MKAALYDHSSFIVRHAYEFFFVYFVSFVVQIDPLRAFAPLRETLFIG